MADRFPGPDPARAGLCCDFDGTLAPIVSTPGAAAMPDSLRPVLADLADRLGVLAVVSGRPAAFLAEHVPVPGVRLLGVYGLEEWTGERAEARPEVAEWIDAIDEARARLERDVDADGARIEDKGITVALHWRNAEDRPDAERRLLALVEEIADDIGLAIEPGKFVAELRPPVDWNKGTTVTALGEELGLSTVAYLGDDLGDISAFQAAQELGGIAVAVASGDETPPELLDVADLTLPGTDAVADWLTDLRERLTR